MPYHIICLKTQKAFKAYLDQQDCDFGNIPKGSVFRGLTAARKTIPCVIIECNSMEMVPEKTGNFYGQVSIKVQHSANGDNDTDEDDHLNNAGIVFDTFFTDTITRDITAAYGLIPGITDGYTCEQVVGVSEGYALIGNIWESELVFRVHCVGRTLT